MIGLFKHILVALGFILWGHFALAQSLTPVVVFDAEQLYSESLLGQAYQAEFDARRDALNAEDRQYELDLTREEQELADLRATMSAEEFAPLAAAFDDKAERIRAEQDLKLQELTQYQEQMRRDFFNQAVRVIAEVSLARNADVVLESRTVFLSSERADITQDVIDALDAQFQSETEQ